MDTNQRQQLKILLQEAGLKVSLVRLKVLEVLLRAEQDSRSLSSRALFTELQQASEQISLMTVRQVLCRLNACGLVVRQRDAGYRLSAPAVAA
ncbi:hypothetical protein A9179_05965 [Pseudomonas alcaligenes]|uniref:Ferric uptake regulation protein n=1 Tax=Aquipseudomonas alcaligenes TaxID=43263 RepID=A0ABR7RYJ2_AQUAC|nr:transcriptional repressor [Pseudomonas alcaligenes]MBC9249817.1 hypothetical protein [Pseudomonas alcaligenes]